MAQFDLSAMADMAWMLALAAMAIRSLMAWKALPQDAWVPLQWGPDNEPIMTSGRDLAVTFTPVAALVGGLLLAAGERLQGDAVSVGVILARFLAPLMLVFAHRWHLDAAVAAVQAEAEG